MQCTILSNPRASPTNSPQLIRTQPLGLVPHTPLVHPLPLPVIPSTQTAICLITCSPFTITRTPSHTTPLHLQTEAFLSTSLDNPSASARAHREAPRVRSSHPIGNSSYSSARCIFICSHRRLVFRDNIFILSDDSCLSVPSSSRSCQRYGLSHCNKVRNSYHKPQ